MKRDLPCPISPKTQMWHWLSRDREASTTPAGKLIISFIAISYGVFRLVISNIFIIHQLYCYQ